MTVWEPTASAAVVRLVWPLTRPTVASGLPSAVTATVPTGVSVAGGLAVTVTVNVTGWPNTDGLEDEATVVVVAATIEPLAASWNAGRNWSSLLIWKVAVLLPRSVPWKRIVQLSSSPGLMVTGVAG